MDGERERIYADIKDRLPVGLALLDEHGSVVLTNPALARILGYPEEVIRERPWASLFLDPEANLEFNQALLDALVEEKTPLSREVDYQRPDGEMLRLSLITSCHRRDNGAAAGLVVIVSDVTTLHELHEREKKALEERTRLERRRVEGLSRLALSVAHQIRNPVMSIGGFAGLALRKLPGDARDLSGYLETIRESARRLERVVEAVSDYAGLPTPIPRLVSLGELLDDLNAERPDLGAMVALDTPREGELLADPGLLRRVLVELAENARAFCASGPPCLRLGVETTKDGSVRLSAVDAGPGIEPAALPYMFDPFATTRSDAVGMGLAVVRRIAEEHGGGVEAGNDPRGGARIVLTLPGPETSPCMAQAAGEAL